MPLNKIVVKGQTLLDLSNDTIETNKLLKGVTAHDAHGKTIEGDIETWNPDAEGSIEYTDTTFSDGGNLRMFLEDSYDYFDIIDHGIQNIGTFKLFNPASAINLRDIVGNNVKYIGSNAFYGDFPYLRTVSFPNCEFIADNAFYINLGNSGPNSSAYTFDEIDFNFSNLSRIGNACFQMNKRYINTKNIFPKIEYIGNRASWGGSQCTILFGNPNRFFSIAFSRLSHIGDLALAYNEYLDEIHLPKINYIGTSAFKDSTRLFDFYIATEALSVPTLTATNAFDGTPILSSSNYKWSSESEAFVTTAQPEYGHIFVPGNLYPFFLDETNWSTLQDRIVPVAFEGIIVMKNNVDVDFNTFYNDYITINDLAVVGNPDVDITNISISDENNLFSEKNIIYNENNIMSLALRSNGTLGSEVLSISIQTSDGETKIISININVRNFEIKKLYKIENSFQYGFTKSGEYYVSGNKGVNNSFAMCKLIITSNEATTLTIKYINSGESNFDFGIFSNLNTALTASQTADTSGVYKNCKGESSTDVKTVAYSIPVGESYIYIKFVKDSSTSQGLDSLQFKLEGEWEEI